MVATASTRETEIKIPIADVEAARRAIESAGFIPSTERLFEVNTLWDTPQRSLKQSGELTRIREVGGRLILTYKGPNEPGKHRSCEELESSLSSTAPVERILTRVGLVPVFRYEKYRTEFKRADQAGTILLDETPIGNFIELEGEPDWIDQTAAVLGYEEHLYVTASYSVLYTKNCERQGIPATNMIFAKPSH